ncbi:MAG: hydantoinase B/oxoprolinase family protein [Lentisphaeria bacterium]|nr:hydantoinase B/oxoprolinase family protein [Lentisphaeria bacterium]
MKFWIDRGGTFTDIVAISNDGHYQCHKLLSENPEQYKDAAIQGIRDLLNLPNGPIPSSAITHIKMGTTVATNALLERKGEKTAFITSKGFQDTLRIGFQSRPELFAKEIRKPELLYEEVIELRERIDITGQVLCPLDDVEVKQALAQLQANGIQSLAICLAHAWQFPAHEQHIFELAQAFSFKHISLSHKVSPLIKFISRADTTLVDAYLSPILHQYVEQVTRELGEGIKLQFMKSSGNLTLASGFHGKDAIVSGPAGGVVACVETAKELGFDQVIGFDMGGTSTDVSHYAGKFERSYETTVAGVRIAAPMLDIHTVAAGGGSILFAESGRFRVGPESAGANPGPKAYRREGPLTVTDANIMLGRIQVEHFPKIFGPNQDLPLDKVRVQQAFIEIAKPLGMSAEEVASGFLEVAIENMANAIRKVSVARGYDVRDYLLNCFGGAGGQHVCKIAENLDMNTILVHPYSGILSAYGMGLAEQKTLYYRSTNLRFNESNLHTIPSLVAEIFTRNDIAPNKSYEVLVHLQSKGTEAIIPINFNHYDQMLIDYAEQYQQLFGFYDDSKPVIISQLEVEVLEECREVESFSTIISPEERAYSHRLSSIYIDGDWLEVKTLNAEQVNCKNSIIGPALILAPNQTIIIEPNWQIKKASNGSFIIERMLQGTTPHKISTYRNPVQLELFNNRFMSIAEQMGFTLQKTAQSVNIRERLDFSCAIFDKDGFLVANAPHVPVHLGSMEASVQSIIRNNPTISSGDVFLINNPYDGGTHLPDLTVVTPVFTDNLRSLSFWVASRGHHADIGGISPGSTSPNATSIDQEGILIRNFKVVKKGILQESELKALLCNHSYPVRNYQQNYSDLLAQISANRIGQNLLLELCQQYSTQTVIAYMSYVQDYAEEVVRKLIKELPIGQTSYQTDHGHKINIQLSKSEQYFRIDFTGTSKQLSTNFNAPAPVTQAAVLYTIRVLLEENIPLNSGCLRPIDLVIPEGSMLHPHYPAAVVAGNTETSQHVVNALFQAIGALANAQGTMNNFTYGNSIFQNYETICGGAPAGFHRNGKAFSGADGVHTHMTNTRMTDPEILEQRFPLIVEKFEIRKGKERIQNELPGGCGVIRRLRFLADVDCAIVSSHRTIAPRGLNGGSSGQCGKNFHILRGGETKKLTSCCQIRVVAGEAIEIHTPGAGSVQI